MREHRIGHVDLELEDEVFDSPYVAEKLQNGSYEVQERRLIDRYSSELEDLDVIELGGGVGVVSVAINRVTNGRHLVLEPDSRNVEMLERTRELNDAKFSILPYAYEPREDTVEIKISTEFWNSAIEEHQYLEELRTEEVSAASLMSLRRDYDIDEFALVSDIEGAEEMLLEERKVMEDCEFAIVEFHRYEESELDTDWFSETFEMEQVDREDSVVAFRRKDD